jgi:hypothetical protein
MSTFAEIWPEEEFVQATLAQLPCYHHIALIEKLKTREERECYAQQTIQNGWSRNVLVHQIESGLRARHGRALTNFDRTLPAPQSELAQQILKDPPVRMGVPFVGLTAPLLGVIGARGHSSGAAHGIGQHVDVSTLNVMTTLVSANRSIPAPKNARS